MFSLVPGIDDSDVRSSSESAKSGSECGDDDHDDDGDACGNASERTYSSHLSDDHDDCEIDKATDPGTYCIGIETKESQAECMPPTGISHQNWQKFQSLQKRRSETQRNQDVTSSRIYKKRRRRKRRRPDTTDTHNNTKNDAPESHLKASITAESSNDPASSTGATSSKQQEHWDTLKKYLDVNAHMKGLDQGKYAPKSGMEKKLDVAVAEGDFDTAEEISDDLARRELACKIAKAANARDYLALKQEQDERKEANRKKRRKLAWGFEPKERWEMKGNM